MFSLRMLRRFISCFGFVFFILLTKIVRKLHRLKKKRTVFETHNGTK